jgi:hypothetical protein
MATWQEIPTPHPYRLGQCKPCQKRYSWPANKLPLSSMACPNCQAPLTQTTALGHIPFIALVRAPYRHGA